MTSMKTLSAIMFGAINVMGSIPIQQTKVDELYNGLLNGAGDINKFNAAMENFNLLKYCPPPTGQCIANKAEFESMIQNKYFGDNNLIAKSCDITVGKPDSPNDPSADAYCTFTFQSTSQKCTEERVKQHMDYDPYGDKIIQYFDMEPVNSKEINCPSSHGRRLISKYWETTAEPTTTTTQKPTSWAKPSIKPTIPIDKCYDENYNNPCNAAQRASAIYYFPSCSSCCSFIQCDDFGVAKEMPCAPGTYWDQKALTCNHNDNDQCNDYKCTQYEPSPKPTPKPSSTWTEQPTRPVKKCYDINYDDVCNAEQRESGIYYFPSCDSCCSFIQCDNFGKAFEMPCPAGTFWDQSVLTCNHNNGQCNDYKCKATTTTKPPTKWSTTTKAPTKWSTTTTKPTTAPTQWTTTKQPTRKPTWTTTTKKPTNAPTTKIPTHSPTKWTTTNKPTTTTNKPTNAPTKKPSTAPTKKPSTAPTKKPCDKDKGKDKGQYGQERKW